MSWLFDFEYLNVFFGKLKFKKMPKFETLSVLRGLILMSCFGCVHLVVMTGLVSLLRKVVERKQTKASAANTLVPKLKMSFALNTAAFSDPDARKSLIESSMDCKMFFSLFFPMFLSRSATK